MHKTIVAPSRKEKITRGVTMRATSTELEDTTPVTDHVPAKESRARELQRAREMLQGLQTRTSTEKATQAEMKELRDILSTVVDALSRLEMQDNTDDAGTAATHQETVGSNDNEDLLVSRLDEGYGDSSDDNEYQSSYNEPRRIPKKNRVEERQESYDDFLIDETELSQALGGYEEGFYPEVCDVPVSFNDPLVGSNVSVGLGTPRTRQTKAPASVSEESLCFYCAIHGNGERCSGTKFCI